MAAFNITDPAIIACYISAFRELFLIQLLHMLNVEMSVKWMLSSVQECAVWVTVKDLHPWCMLCGSLMRCLDDWLLWDAAVIPGFPPRLRDEQWGWSNEGEDIIIAISRQRDLIKWAQAILSPWLPNPFLFHPITFVCFSLISPFFLSVSPLSLIFQLCGGWIRLSCILCMLV